jgi:hypothetical protein
MLDDRPLRERSEFGRENVVRRLSQLRGGSAQGKVEMGRL